MATSSITAAMTTAATVASGSDFERTGDDEVTGASQQRVKDQAGTAA
jgi:hypothetical protein